MNPNDCSGLFLAVPDENHEAEYGRVMDRWEALEENIQPELLRRYSKAAGANVSYQRFLEWCADDRTTGAMLSTGVPCTLYFLMNPAGEMLGAIAVNHGATHRGHCHAGIAPWHRDKGYGTAMLRLALSQCRALGMQHVQIVPYKNNISAAQTIVRNGGVLLEEFCEDGVWSLRYEIDISAY